MGFWARVPLVLLVGASFLGAAPPGRAESPVAYKHLTYQYEVQATGSYVLTVHFELLASNAAAASQIGQIPLAYTESLENLDILEAYTLKASGKRLKVATDAIYGQLTPGSPDQPFFNDHKQKVVIFPDVASGDAVVVTYKRTSKVPLFPGQFTASFSFDRTMQYDDVGISISAPATLPLNVETHGLKFDKRNDGGRITYQWHYANQNAMIEDPAVVSGFDRLPRVFVSSFADYDAMARAYAKLLEGKIVVSPKVKQLADEITAGVVDRRQQAQMIYQWVSTHIRYVAVELGKGNLVPHNPDLVIANAYGDCKDHSVLFVSLLKAKGIDAEAVLINGDNSYRLADSPNLSQLNHMITWLPEFGLYVDTTAGTAAFGTLPIEEYGKPVVVVGGAMPALRRIPVLATDSDSESIRSVAQLQADGSIHGTTVMTARGPIATILRSEGVFIQSRGPERIAKAEIESAGFEGSGTFTVAPPGILAPDYTITAKFDLMPRPRLLTGDSFVPPLVLDVLPWPGDVLIGPLNIPDLPTTEDTPCFGGTQMEELSLELPAGRRVGILPKDTVIEDSEFHYSSHWALAGPILSVRREFTSKTSAPLCTAKVRQDAAAALKKIREDYRQTITLSGTP